MLMRSSSMILMMRWASTLVGLAKFCSMRFCSMRLCVRSGPQPPSVAVSASALTASRDFYSSSKDEITVSFKFNY